MSAHRLFLSVAAALSGLAATAEPTVLSRVSDWNGTSCSDKSAKASISEDADGAVLFRVEGPASLKARCNLSTKCTVPLKADTRYRLSCEMRSDEPGIVSLGVGSWPKGFDVHFAKLIPFRVGAGWEKQSFEFKTPTTNAIPALATGLTQALVTLPYGAGANNFGTGAKSVRLRNWTLAELPRRDLPPETRPPTGNAVPNASFELGLAPFGVQSMTDYGPATVPPSWTIDEAASVHGRRSLRIDNTRTGFRTRVVSPWVEPGPGRWVVVSAWVKADRETEVVLEAMDAFFDSELQTGKWFVNRRPFEVGTGWRRIVLVRPKDERLRRFTVIVRSDRPCVFWLDALQVECGDAKEPSGFRPAAAAETAYALDRHLFLKGERAEVVKTSLTYADPASLKAEKLPLPTDRFGVFTYGEGLGVRYAVVGDVPPADPDFQTGFNGFECLFTDAGGRVLWRDDGMHSVDEHFRQLRLAGATMVRLHDSGTWWWNTEPEKGVYDWAKLDVSVAMCRKYGIAPMIVFGNGGVVGERSDRATEERLRKWFARKNGSYHPSGLGKRRCIQIATDDWDSWIRAVVTRYRGKVGHYEIYNEPNLTCPSAETYAAYLKRSYGLIRELDPSAVVIGICSTGDYGADTGSFVRTAGDLGAFGNLDWVSFHPYNAMMDFTVQDAETQLKLIRSIADGYRPGVPLINDELYYMADRRFVTHDSALSRDWPAGNLVRRYTMDKAAGLKGSLSITANQLYDGDAGHPGLREVAWFATSWQPGERFVAANAFARLMTGAKFVRKPDVPDGANAFTFRRPDGREITVMWMVRNGRSCAYGLSAGSMAFDLRGNALPGGSLSLSSEPVYVVSRKGL